MEGDASNRSIPFLHAARPHPTHKKIPLRLQGEVLCVMHISFYNFIHLRAVRMDAGASDLESYRFAIANHSVLV